MYYPTFPLTPAPVVIFVCRSSAAYMYFTEFEETPSELLRHVTYPDAYGGEIES